MFSFRLAFIATLLAVVSAQSWAPISSDTETILFCVSCAAEDNCFTVAGNNQVGALVQRSTDGGKVWRKMVSPPTMGLLTIAMERSSTESKGVASGFSIGQSADLYTTDGEVFNMSTTRSPYVTAAQDSSTVTGLQDGFAIVGQFGGASGVKLSKDGGVTYSEFKYPVIRDIARYGSFPSPTTWFITGGEFPSDPASHQLSHRIRIPHKADANGRRDVLLGAYPKALGNTTGYSASICVTTDGGKTFTQVFNDVGRFYFNQIDCISTEICYAVAEGFDGDWVNAAVYKTVDGGKTWTQNLLVPNASMMAVNMLSTTEIWVGGVQVDGKAESGTFWHSTDAGTTWIVDSSFINTAIVDMDFLSTTSGWAAVMERAGVSTLYRFN